MPRAKTPFVFLDHGGRRWPLLRRWGFLLTLLAAISMVLFVQSLFVKPEIRKANQMVLQLKQQIKAIQEPRLSGSSEPPETNWRKYLAQSPASAERIAKLREQFRNESVTSKQRPIRLGWVDASDPDSLTSLDAHATQLTHIAIRWLSHAGEGNGLVTSGEPPPDKPARGHDLILMPVLDNLDGDEWLPEAVENLARANSDERVGFLDQLESHLEEVRAGGVIIDWEQIDPAYKDAYTGFLRQIASRLHREKRELWLNVPMGDELAAFDIPAIAEFADRFIAVLHDENSEHDTPGPIASQPWFDGWLEVVQQFGNPGQWILELGCYAYDWREGGATADLLSFADAMSRAHHAGVSSASSVEPALNPSYSYADSEGSHEVWMLDAVTFFNQLRAAEKEDWGGIALYALGSEDPHVWDVINTKPDNIKPESLEKLAGDETVTNVGIGEIVTVDDAHTDGLRSVQSSSNGMLHTVYTTFPCYPTIFHAGTGPAPGATGGGLVALTFDDGPDPDWTPRILDILKAKDVKATFFIVGNNAEQYPGLIRRIVREGHEIGNHTYFHLNLGEASEQRIRLETDATQRLIESITDRSLTLFRPPYQADSRPSSLAELRPLKLIQDDLEYIIVLENVDPEDWAKPGADEILRRVKMLRPQGNIVLLHDAGGNRSETVEALPKIIDWLRERGDQLVTVGGLLNIPYDEVMPRTRGDNQMASRITAKAGFTVWHILENFAWSFMLVSTFLVILRTLVMVILAIVHARRSSAGQPAFTPPVSIVIAAYNEENVIGPTLRAVLETDYPGAYDVVIVDDGSTDGTAKVAEDVAASDPRIRVVRQANAGKSNALKNGVTQARNEILVFLDADTQFERGTIGALVAPLADPAVGAVAGHARVGNLRSFLARCQSLEYTCGFNLDRRAYTVLDCAIVVPGAVSAIRRQALAEAGGFSHDTLAEDTDLTLTLHRLGWRIGYAPTAFAHTEAPETFRALEKQRFRWAFGTLQCLWKHRDLCFHPKAGALGWFSLPSVWFFQIILVALSPIIDAMLLLSLISGGGSTMWMYFIVYLVADLALAVVACVLDGEKITKACRILPMRFVYRPLLAWVIWRSIFQALKGAWVGWGKLERTASVPSHI